MRFGICAAAKIERVLDDIDRAASKLLVSGANQLTASAARSRSKESLRQKRKGSKKTASKQRKADRDAVTDLLASLLREISEDADKGKRSAVFSDERINENTLKVALKKLSKKPYSYKVQDLGEKEEKFTNGSGDEYTQMVHSWRVSW